MRKSFIFNSLSDRYSKDYRALPQSDDITLPPLQYEPEEQRQDIQIHPADKKGWLYYLNQSASSRSTTKLKKFWAVLRRLGDEADGEEVLARDVLVVDRVLEGAIRQLQHDQERVL